MTSRLWAPLLLAAVSLGAPALAERKSGVAVRPSQVRSAARVSAAGAPASCATGFPCHMLYYGGHVIPNAKIYVVNWTAGVSAGGDLGAFYDAVTNSTYLDWLNEYDTNITTTAPSAVSSVPPGSPGTNQFIGRGVYAGTFTITPSPANAGGTAACSASVTTNCCPAGAPSGDTCLTDAQIQSELDLQIKNGKLPAADENSLYTTYFPPKYFISDASVGGSCVSHGFCGYHGTSHGTASGHEFYYGVLPDHGQGSGCDIGCGTTCTTGDTACYFDNLTSTSGHELCEAITDAEVGFNQDATTGWYDPGDNNQNQNGEIGDMCNAGTRVAGFNVQNVFSNLVAAADPTLATACVVTRVAANDFSVSLASNKKKLTGGTNIQVPISTTKTSGSSGMLALSFSGLPAHVSGALDHASVAAGAGAMLTLTADSGATAIKDVVVQIKACSPACATAGSTIHTAGLLLDLVPGTANDFSLSITPPPGGTTIAPNTNADYAVNTRVIGTFTTPISLSVSGLPTVVHGAFTPASVTPGQSSILKLSVDAGAATTASTTFTVTGTAGATSHGSTSVVAVGTASTTGNDFTISIAPPADTNIAPGASADYSIDTIISAGSEENVALTITPALPTGLHASFAPATVASGASSTLTISVDVGTPNHAAVSFTVTGTAASGPPRTASSSVGVVGPNTFALAITQTTGTVAVGGHVSYTITSAATSGDTSEGISLSLSGLPSGVTGTFLPSVIHAGDSATLALAADSSTLAGGPSTFEVDGNSLSDFQYATSDLIVVGSTATANDFSLSLSPASPTVAQGHSIDVAVASSVVSGTAESIALAASGLPSGVSASFAPGSVTAGASSTLTLHASSSAALVSSASFTVTGTAASASHSAAGSITVGSSAGPTVAITHPTGGATVSGSVEIDATATPGPGATLLKIELLVDGAVVASPTSSPAQGFWQSTETPDGSHLIEARAVDSSGGSTLSAPVTVTVDNASAPPVQHGGGGCASSGAGLFSLLGLAALRRRRRPVA